MSIITCKKCLYPFVLGLLLACNPDPEKLESKDFGPEVTEQDIVNAITLARLDYKPEETKICESATFQYSQRSLTTPMQVTKILFKRVVQKEIQNGIVKLSIHQNRKDETTPPEGIDEEAPPEYYYASSPAELELEAAHSHLQAIRSFVKNRLKNLQVADNDTKVTYHKLTTEAQFIQPPEKVKNQPNCLGIANCRLTGTKINFVRVIWENGAPYEIKEEWLISQQVPLLASILKHCQTGALKITENTTTVYTLCSDVTNFSWENIEAGKCPL